MFIVILASLLTFNVFFLWYSGRADETTPPSQAYRLFRQDLARLPNDERPDFVRRYAEDIKGIETVEKVKRYESWQNEQGDAMAENIKKQDMDAYNRYLSKWEAGGYLRYTQTLMQEAAFSQKLNEEMARLAGYPDYLKEIREKSDTLSGVSIFAGSGASGGFSGDNIKKTASDYAGMEDTVITYDVSHGVTSAVSSQVTDGLAFLFLFVFSFIMVYEEKNKNLFSLVKSTAGGRVKTMAAKITVLAIITGGATLVLYGGNILFYNFSVGLGDLSRSIQSVGAFMGSSMRISVGTFLLVFLLMKWLICFLIGLLVMLISVVMRKSSSAFLICALILAGSFALYSFIPANSDVTILKYINFFGLFSAQDLLGLYLNLDLFDHAVALFTVGCGVTVFLICAFIVISTAVFATKRGGAVSSFRIKIPAYTRRQKRMGKSVWRHELYKALWINKAAVLLAVFFLLTGYQAINAHHYLSPDEMVYKSYMQQLDGSVTDETAAYIEAEQSRFDELKAKLNSIETQLSENVITRTQADELRLPIERALGKENGFQRVLGQYEHVKNTPGAQMVYETGVLELLDTGQSRSTAELMTICLMLILCCYNIFPMEDTRGASKLIGTTVLGREHTNRVKSLISTGFMVLIAAVTLLPAIIQVGNNYGISGLTASARSLPIFSHIPSFINLAAITSFVFMAKLLSATATVVLILRLSRLIKHGIYTLLICALLLALPVILTLAGIDWCAYISFTPFFNAGALLARQESMLLIIYGALTASAAAFGVLGVKRQETRR